MLQLEIGPQRQLLFPDDDDADAHGHAVHPPVLASKLWGWTTRPDDNRVEPMALAIRRVQRRLPPAFRQHSARQSRTLSTKTVRRIRTMQPCQDVDDARSLHLHAVHSFNSARAVPWLTWQKNGQRVVSLNISSLLWTLKSKFCVFYIFDLMITPFYLSYI